MGWGYTALSSSNHISENVGELNWLTVQKPEIPFLVQQTGKFVVRLFQDKFITMIINREKY